MVLSSDSPKSLRVRVQPRLTPVASRTDFPLSDYSNSHLASPSLAHSAFPTASQHLTYLFTVPSSLLIHASHPRDIFFLTLRFSGAPVAAVDSTVGLWMRFPCATAGDWDGRCTARRYLLPAAAAGLIVRCGRVSRLNLEVLLLWIWRGTF